MFSFFKNNKKIYSPTGTAIIVIVGELIMGLLIFHAGAAYGERHVFNRMRMAGFGPQPPVFGFFHHSFIPPEHGAVGTIVSIASSTLTLKTRDGSTQILRYDNMTNIENINGKSSIEQLQTGSTVVVIGDPEPDTNEMTARLIRILPATPPGVQK